MNIVAVTRQPSLRTAWASASIPVIAAMLISCASRTEVVSRPAPHRARRDVPVAAPAPSYVPTLAPIETFAYRWYGHAQDGQLALGARLNVYAFECNAETGTLHACRNVPGLFQDIIDGRHEPPASQISDLRRVQECFDVVARRADAPLVAAVTQTFALRSREEHEAGWQVLQARVATEGPSLWIVLAHGTRLWHPCMELPGDADACQGRAFRFGRTRRVRYERTEDMPSQTIALPAREEFVQGTVGIYDATPRAREVSELGRRGEWSRAEALAIEEAGRTTSEAARVRSLAWTNVVVTAFQARDMDALGRAVDSIQALGEGADHMARLDAEVLGMAARGRAWLSDPCSRVAR